MKFAYDKAFNQELYDAATTTISILGLAGVDEVMLGKFKPNLSEVSYNRVAGTNYTFFEMDNWGDIYGLVNESRNEIWKINEKFIRNQFDANKLKMFK